MPLDEWQEQALEAAMGERSDGRWASKFVGVSAPRQNGKSQLIVARALAGVLLFDEKTIICSAHQTDTAREVFQRLLDVIEDNPSLESRVSAVMKAVNRESITFGKGSKAQTIKVKARVAAGGRGFSSDCLLLDEAQILGKRQWGSIVPTMSARPNPQMWLFGTPPTPEDDAFAFTRVRDASMRGAARHCWLEWAADLNDDFDEPATWAKANPSFGVRISNEACADDRAAMDDEQFAMERLGIWDAGNLGGSALPGWRNRRADGLEVGRPVAIGLAAAVDHGWASIAGASGSAAMVAVGAVDRRPGTAWVVGEATRIQKTYACSVVIDKRGPLADLIPSLLEAGVRLTEVDTADFCDACAQMARAVEEGTIRHPGHPELDNAVHGASWRPVGDRRAFARKTSEISMLEAATLAAWGVTSRANYDVLMSGF